MNGSSSTLRAVVLCIVMGWSTGCAAPVTVYRPVSSVIPDEAGRPLDLQLTTGERYIIRGAQVRGDTLVAVVVKSQPTADSLIVVPVVRIAVLRRTERELTTAGAAATGVTVGLLGGLLVFLSLVLVLAD